jgi:hypothetical protein
LVEEGGAVDPQFREPLEQGCIHEAWGLGFKRAKVAVLALKQSDGSMEIGLAGSDVIGKGSTFLIGQEISDFLQAYSKMV